MRLPFDKIFRAFPELDRFSDSECRRFVSMARREQVGTQLLAAALALVLLFAGFWLGGMLVVWFFKFLVREFQVSMAQYEDTCFICVAIVAFTCGILPAFYVRDRWLRFAVKRYISSTKCPGCAYLLLGLASIDGELTCPECGRHIVLSHLGLTAESLLPEA